MEVATNADAVREAIITQALEKILAEMLVPSLNSERRIQKLRFLIATAIDTQLPKLQMEVIKRTREQLLAQKELEFVTAKRHAENQTKQLLDARAEIRRLISRLESLEKRNAALRKELAGVRQ